MKKTIQLEEAAMFSVSIYALYILKVDWWYYVLLLIGPDISMIGYLIGNRTGAVMYNIFHHKAIAILVMIAGLICQSWTVEVMGIVLFGHSSMDRMFGYGLKHFTGFKDTHLGKIGQPRS
jgi:hypothetical protein